MGTRLSRKEQHMTAEQEPTIPNQTPPFTMAPPLTAEQKLIEHCINHCLEVVKTASACATWCITSDMAPSLAECSRYCLDAATFTATNATMMARGSRFSGAISSVCADLCDSCAAECEKHSQHADIMRQCAETCRRCAESCREVAAVA